MTQDMQKETTVVKTSRFSLPTVREHGIFWPLAMGGLWLDLWSKAAIFGRIDGSETVVLVPGFLSFVRRLNDGAAFSMAAGQRVFLVSISAVALVVIFGIFFFGGKRSRLVTVSLGLFAAGVAGNFYDRAFLGGKVRDFIDVYVGQHHWPTFNVADSFITIGVIILIISIWRGKCTQF